MAHTLGNKQRIPVTANTTSTSNPQAADVTCDAGTTLLVACLFYAGGSDRGGGAPTYNGVAMTQSGAARRGTTSPEASTELWYMKMPPTGSALSLSVPNSGGLAMSIDVSWYIAGAGFGTILDAEGGANKATGTNPTHSVTSITANDLLIGTVAGGHQVWTNLTAQSGTAVFNSDNGAWGGGSQYILDCGTTGSETSSWTHSSSEDHGIQVALFRTITWKTADISDDESSTLVDATSGRYNYRALTSDDASLGLSEDFSANLISAGGNVYDAVNWKVYGVGTPSDALSVDDSGLSARLVYLPQVSDSTVGTDQASGLFKYFASASDNASGTDLASGLFKYLSSALDSAIGSDNLSSILRQLAQCSDNLALSDSTSGLFRNLAALSESPSWSDTVNGLFKYFAQFSEDASGLDSASVLNKYLASLTSETVPTSDSASVMMRQLAILSDDFSSALADLVVHSLIQVGGATPINASFTDDASSGLSDTITALHRLLALASETLDSSDLAGALSRYLAGISEDGATEVDTIVAIQRALVLVSESFSETDDVSATLPILGQLDILLASLSDSLDLSDEAMAMLTSTFVLPTFDFRKPQRIAPGTVMVESFARRIRGSSKTVPGATVKVAGKADVL